MDERTKTIPESAVRAVQMARAKGHLAFINSGRVYKLLGGVRQMIEMDGYLCGCGTYLRLGIGKSMPAIFPMSVGWRLRNS